MKRILIAPSRYQQGKDMLHELGAAIETYGTKALIVASDDDLKRMDNELNAAKAKQKFDAVYGNFGGECTHIEIKRLREVAKEEACDVIIGLGGGKALDTAKAISHFEKLPVIVIPTIASTDAPCSSLAVIYTENGEFDEYMFFTKNPDLVLVDSSVIAKAPVRFLVAGMGDALSTYFEARACEKSFADNIPGGKSTKAAVAIATLCYETLLEDSTKAKAACEGNVVTTALENIIEANILLSGLGFESSGLAAAHAVHNGLTAIEETHHYYHGEKVAFGVLVQLVLENASSEELERVISYNRSVGLPTTLKDLGISEVTPEKVKAIAKLACAEGETIYNMPFKVTEEDVCAAIVSADNLGGM
ncbi:MULTISPECIES: glycerol dehydrogenase [unclassified Fusibacter]|uniref:glycerol dehydrogenase n=1 Tax=unclassified Fusibacter TaxID=2624464 RepID=UPI001010D783|nr:MULTISPECIES: glycerol dehydrogenase [unclassified Fusibacter]MCK8060155.1 glycerol dehydrogenase [Fusibacter sp. A2]NPE22295.1 glycerol dehydrogenase [Fusibacter sp. A1]RXV61068.1 glycerol dehydrogenase [Fusibacter sp. A1]